MVEKTVISTFAGCGGSSLGYKWAGFKELLAIDFDTNAVETFKANFPEVPCWQRDITTVTAKEILEFTGLKVGELDVFDGSPPCQGFSTAGKRILTDNRNDLFKHYCRLITELQPKVFVMENVSGMIKGTFKGKFNEILQTLKDCGYNVKCKLMNSMWYEVPQSRERLIFIGTRNDLNIEPSYPQPLKEFITVEKAIKNITPKTFVKRSKFSDELWHKIKEGTNGYEKNGKKTGFNYCKPQRNKPLPTLLKSVKYCGLGIYHYSDNREYSIEELKVLCSFPIEFNLIGNAENNVNRLGNAVMPKFMYHIAKHIKENILT